MTALIYIGGYGRSGSTLLEALLTARPDILACGEVISCFRPRADRGCTCGRSRTECAVWGPVYTRPGGLRGLTHAGLTRALLEGADEKYSFLVDSSKTSWGLFGAPFKFRRALGDRFHLVHIVRNPRAVCWSNAGGTRKRGLVKHPLLQHLRTSLGWWSANLACELFGWRYPGRYTQVRYDDLARSHHAVLEKLFAALPNTDAPNTPSSEAESAAKDNRHQLFGNHNRYKGYRAGDIREDTRWKAAMPARQQTLVAALTWPLRRRYGY